MVINMDAANLGGSAITALSQFVPTPDESTRVSKFILQQHNKAQEGAPKDEKGAAPAATTDVSKIDTKRITELKIGKAEQYIFFMSRVCYCYQSTKYPT